MTGEVPAAGRIVLPELLAPAGSPEALRAAVAAGADAVYLSGKRFGARRFAANFSDGEIAEGVRYAHSRGVRVYVTVNTLIHDRELAGVAEYLVWLYSVGIDAVLVQDIGVAALARRIVPDLAIHASTQMTIHNTDGVLWAAEQGFSRVVLARELSLAEVSAIAGKTNGTGTGLEVFAHGALCYSYSGQCLLSSVIGGRSGNRGMCAQPCRKPYQLVTGDGDDGGRTGSLRTIPLHDQYLLSPKDLCTYSRLPELVQAPVVSLKIEGRMKSPEYVAIVVSTYRMALDAIAKGSWTPSPAAERDLLLAFNRGFTGGYLFGDRHAALMARDAPDNRGICIGIVTKSNPSGGRIVIRLQGTIVPVTGDGLLFTEPAKRYEEWGYSLNNTPVVREAGVITLVAPRPVRQGARVYLTSSRDLESRARQIITHPPADLQRTIPIDLSICVGPRGSLAMEGVIAGAHREIRIAYQPDFCLVPAHSRPLSRDQFAEQMKKTGTTPFLIRDLSLTYGGDLFAPLSELNRIRREFLSRAEKEVLASFCPSVVEIASARERCKQESLEGSGGISSHIPGPPSRLLLSVYADSPEAVSAAVTGGCDIICFEPQLVSPVYPCGCGSGGQTVESRVSAVMTLCRDAGVRFILKFPGITHDDYLAQVVSLLPVLCGQGLTECMADNPGTARAIRDSGHSLTISGSAGLLVFNHLTACHLSSSFSLLTLSPEMSAEECRGLVKNARAKKCTARFSVIVQGSIETMISEDCILKEAMNGRDPEKNDQDTRFFGLRDSTGHVFPVRVDGECRSHVCNANEICLIDHLPAIWEIGISEVVIDTRGRSVSYAHDMTRIYREAVDSINAGTAPMEGSFQPLKDRIRHLARGGITTGHFIRGLKD